MKTSIFFATCFRPKLLEGGMIDFYFWAGIVICMVSGTMLLMFGRDLRGVLAFFLGLFVIIYAGFFR